ncbi:DUF2586 family protein, partial [Salmonella enterica subsp. enterica serovar Montevideo]|nr:DUF2586 family protein [Salmonella enterica subsp. enterica serovar Montevideo]
MAKKVSKFFRIGVEGDTCDGRIISASDIQEMAVWADGRTLDVEGGDYQSIETLRIVDKAARRVRLLAIGKIADRS